VGAVFLHATTLTAEGELFCNLPSTHRAAPTLRIVHYRPLNTFAAWPPTSGRIGALAHRNMDDLQWGNLRRNFTFRQTSGGSEVPLHARHFTSFVGGPSYYTYPQSPAVPHWSLQHNNLPTHTVTSGMSSFEEGFVDPHEPVLADPVLRPLPVVQAHARASRSDLRPLQPTSQLPLWYNTPNAAPIKTESSIAWPGPEILPGRVDSSQYSDISFDDWMQSSVEYDASSPSSAATLSDGPFTPISSSNSSFLDVYVRGDHHLHNPVALDCIRKVESDPEMILHMPPTGHAQFARHAPGAFLNPDTNASDWSHVVNNMATLQTQHAPSHDAEAASVYNSAPRFPSYSPSAVSESWAAEGSSSIDNLNASFHSTNTLSTSFSSRASDGLCDETRDELLVRKRHEGMKYGDIKRRYGFHEAESTLRGKYRALTTLPRDRVRKPSWTKKDVSRSLTPGTFAGTGTDTNDKQLRLLRDAQTYFLVEEGYQHKAKSYRKVPWKKVADWMLEHGASYAFGPGTCARKASELAVQQEGAAAASAARKRLRVVRKED